MQWKKLTESTIASKGTKQYVVGKSTLMNPTNESSLSTLKRLELAVYDAGIDGGMTTSEAIDELRAFEDRINVRNSEAKTPRWQNPTDKDRIAAQEE